MISKTLKNLLLHKVPSPFMLSLSREMYSVTPNQMTNAVASNTNKQKESEQQLFGVFKELESDDVDVLVNNFTSPALARALREREMTLHNAAHLLDIDNLAELKKVLRPFLKSSVDKRRQEFIQWDITNGITRRELILIQVLMIIIILLSFGSDATIRSRY